MVREYIYVGVDVVVCLEGYSTVLLLSCSITTRVLGSPSLLPSCFKIKIKHYCTTHNDINVFLLLVSCVHVAFSYQVLRSIHCENVVIYLCVLAVGVACFFVGNKYKLTCPWFSILSHSLVHILGNVANFILYSGKVPPPDTLKQLIL